MFFISITIYRPGGWISQKPVISPRVLTAQGRPAYTCSSQSSHSEIQLQWKLQPLPSQTLCPAEFLTLCLPLRRGRRLLWRAKSKLYFLSCFLPLCSLYLFLETPCGTHPPTLPQKNPKKASQLYLNTTQVFRTSSGLLVRSGSPSGLGAILIHRMQSSRRDLGLGG